ncbi:transposase [Lactobacillus amylovorus]|nr:transposase [Lactobacillus amylovorus]MDB6251831.1 transposase [Lactobacillus amylovorus]MDB6266305.1 transposase [Lactobacillus amylovorus]
METLKATNEELLKQVAFLTEQVEYLTRKLYGKSSEKNVVNTNQLSLFNEEKAGGEDDEDLPSHYRNYYL